MSKIFICGDIINYKQGTVDFIGDDLVSKIRESDYAVCNFEGPEVLLGEKVSFPHQEPGTSQYLTSIGFDLMLLANNHITEQGVEGVKYTIETITKSGANYIGVGLSWEETYRPLIQDINGLRFGFINICEAQVGQYLSHDQSFGYAWMGYVGLLKDIERLSTETDYVIVFVHAGLEHYSIPLPEFRSFYHSLCNAGASVVIGGHTHTAQGYEYIDDKLIVYSLGNFYFPHDDDNRVDENTSYSIILDFNKAGNIKLTPIYHLYSNGKVDLITNESKKINLDYLCNLLTKDYEFHTNKMCMDVYSNLCSRLLASATCGEYEEITIKEVLKNIIRFSLFRNRYVKNTKKQRQELLLRLFENESYRNAIIRALKYKCNNK